MTSARVGAGAGQRVIERECVHCGTLFEVAPKGGTRRYCSDRCRRRAWALRDAHTDGGTSPPRVVREVVARTLRPEPRAADWVGLLGLLTEQLTDPQTPLVREHWHHRRLLDALETASTALDHVHPGGLARRR